uniref:Deoxyribonuclease-1-like 1 n=1 Tax=Apteryx owenii TaxID=8824 RepID=A0A8B9S9S3_APTOW
MGGELPYGAGAAKTIPAGGPGRDGPPPWGRRCCCCWRRCWGVPRPSALAPSTRGAWGVARRHGTTCGGPSGGTVGPGTYQALSSPPLGRGSYRERYVYFYRPGRAQLQDWFVYEDAHPQRPDVFAREPFVARFGLPSPALPELVLVPLHAAPAAAETEIDALHDVYERVRERWGQQDVLFLGDFNAGCGYVAASRWGRIRLRRDPPFHWLLGDDGDSTVRGSTRCPYDRVVVAGERSQSLVVPGSAGAFNFTACFGLTEEQALVVSDHYPVEVELALDRAWGGGWHPPLALLLGLGGALLGLP